MPIHPPSVDLLAKRKRKRAAALLPKVRVDTVEDVPGSAVFLPDMVNALRKASPRAEIPGGVFKIIAEYLLRSSVVACSISGLGYEPYHLRVLITSQLKPQSIFFQFQYCKTSYARGVFGVNGIPPIDLVTVDKYTGEVTLLDESVDVGTVLRSQGYRWDQVLLQDPTQRPILEIGRRYRHSSSHQGTSPPLLPFPLLFGNH